MSARSHSMTVVGHLAALQTSFKKVFQTVTWSTQITRVDVFCAECEVRVICNGHFLGLEEVMHYFLGSGLDFSWEIS